MTELVQSTRAAEDSERGEVNAPEPTPMTAPVSREPQRLGWRGVWWFACGVSGSLAIGWFIIFSGAAVPEIVIGTLDLFVKFNLLLMVFNLVPIPPLDGSKVLFAFLDPETERRYRPVLEQYGPILLLILVFSSAFGGPIILGQIITDILSPLYRLLVGVG